MKNTTLIGDKTEAAILSYCLNKGYGVSVPFGTLKYDLVVDKDKKLYRVQCKTGTYRKGTISFKTCSVGRPNKTFYKDEADVFAVYYPPSEEVYWVPIENACSGGGMALRIEPTLNNQQNGVRWAKDYVLG